MFRVCLEECQCSGHRVAYKTVARGLAWGHDCDPGVSNLIMLYQVWVELYLLVQLHVIYSLFLNCRLFLHFFKKKSR